MWETISSIMLKYWVEFALGLIVAVGGFFLRRYIKLEKAERSREQKEYFENLTNSIKEENAAIITSLKTEHDEMNQRSDKRYNELVKQSQDTYIEITTKVQEAMLAGRDESKADDACLQGQISEMSSELGFLKAGLLSIQGKEFRENCRKLLADDHEITLDEWEEIDADHEAYNGLGGNHKGDHLYELVKKKAERTLTD